MKGFEAWVKEIDPNGSWTRSQMDSAKAIFKAGYEAGIASERCVDLNDEIVEDVYDYFIEKTNKKHKLTPSRKKNIKSRLSDGYTVDQLRYVIDYIASEWLGHKCNDPNGFDGDKYSDINVIFGSSDKIDRYIRNWDAILKQRGSKPVDKPKDTVITRKVDSDIKPSFM